MASVTVDRGGRVLICSGSKICSVENMKSESIQVFQPTLSAEDGADKLNGDSATENGGKVKQNGGKVKQNGAENKENGNNIVCMGLSGCGEYLAVCGENKVLAVFHKYIQVCSTLLTRKASKLVFSRDAEFVVVADKNGDVYKFKCTQTTENQPELVLGHLSMLLDLQLSPDNRYVLTADRDEKIRVSMFPNGYNINNYCLGHTDFVTTISLLGSELLVSGSGDGTIRVWKYSEGKQLAVREILKDIDVRLNRKQDNSVNTNLQEMDLDRKRNEPPDHPAVVKLKALTDHLMFLAQIEGGSGLVLYSFSDTVDQVQTLDLTDTLLDFDLHPSDNSVTCLTRTKDFKVILKKFEFSRESRVYEAGADLEVPGDKVEVGDEEKDGLRNLHKRWFDNMKDYMERKQMRIEKSKTKTETAAKKQKISS